MQDDRFPAIEPYDSGMLDAGDGHQVYWECCGNPAGRRALYLHGGPGSGFSPGQRRFFDPDAHRVVLLGSTWGITRAGSTWGITRAGAPLRSVAFSRCNRARRR
jgi:hypothetical protein